MFRMVVGTILLLASAMGASAQSGGTVSFIGSGTTEWYQAMSDDLLGTLRASNYTVDTHPAVGGSDEERVAAVENDIAAGVKAIFITWPSAPMLPTMKKAMEHGVPVFIVGTPPQGATYKEHFTSALQWDFGDEARSAAEALAAKVDASALVLHLTGEPTFSATGQRETAFQDALAAFADSKSQRPFEVLNLPATSGEQSAQQAINDALAAHGGRTIAIYADSAEMAKGAVAALNDVGLDPGVNAFVASPMDLSSWAVDAVKAGDLFGTPQCGLAFGIEAKKVLADYFNGVIPPEYIQVGSVPCTSCDCSQESCKTCPQCQKK